MTKRASDAPLIRHGSGAPQTEGISTSSRSECGALEAWVSLSRQSTLAIVTLDGSTAKTAEMLYLPTLVLCGAQITLSVGISHLVPALAPFILRMDVVAMMGGTHNALLTPLCEMGRITTRPPVSSHIITFPGVVALCMRPQAHSLRRRLRCSSASTRATIRTVGVVSFRLI